jgi:hypothetical protein
MWTTIKKWVNDYCVIYYPMTAPSRATVSSRREGGAARRPAGHASPRRRRPRAVRVPGVHSQQPHPRPARYATGDRTGDDGGRQTSTPAPRRFFVVAPCGVRHLDAAGCYLWRLDLQGEPGEPRRPHHQRGAPSCASARGPHRRGPRAPDPEKPTIAATSSACSAAAGMYATE